MDASIAASWAFKDEAHSRAELALAKVGPEEAVTPALWWFEVRNTMVVNERRGRIREAETARFLGALARLPYLELAQREGLPLATLDGDLERAARAEKVPLLGDRRGVRR